MTDRARRLRRGGERRRDRGQLVLVGGLVVAIGLVALVLLLNTALFTENVATRGLAPGGERAYDHATFAERAGESVLRAADRPATERSDPQVVETAVTGAVSRVADSTGNLSLQQHGAYTELTVANSTRGTALVQNASREFTSTDSSGSWTLAETNGIRRFTTTVDAGSMPTTSDAFTVEVSGGEGTWRGYVNATADGTVRVTAGGETCTSDAATATINWTNGTLDGCTFPFAVDAAGAPVGDQLTLRFENGSRATGTYFLVVATEGTESSVASTNFADPGSGTSPRWYRTMYGLELTAYYDDRDVQYRTTVRVAPDEPPQTSIAA